MSAPSTQEADALGYRATDKSTTVTWVRPCLQKKKKVYKSVYVYEKESVCVLYLSANITDLGLLIVCEKLFWCLYSEEMWDSTFHCLIF